MRSFYVFKRDNGFYYARAIDSVSGKITLTRSTGAKDRYNAMLVVADWQKNGVPQIDGRKKPVINPNPQTGFLSELVSLDFTKPENISKLLQFIQTTVGNVAVQEILQSQPPASTQQTTQPTPQSKLKNDIRDIKLVDYLLDFWTPEKSKYIRERRAHGLKIGERHCYEMQNRVKNHWTAHFGDTLLGTLLGELDSEDLSDFFLDLKETRNLSGSTINNVMNAGNVAFKWAFEHKQLSENLSEGVMRFAVNSRERGILTENEAQQLFKNDWKGARAKTANLLAMTTGMCAGEILALRPCDIKDNYIEVAHSWNEKDGLKCPKNGKARKVPLISGVRDMLLKLAASNPHGISTANFIFYSTLPNQPVVFGVISDNLSLALQNIGIGEEEEAGAQYRFSQLATLLHSADYETCGTCADTTSLGHLTPDMTKHYANHKTIEDLQIIEQAVNAAFSNVVQFVRSA